MKKIITLFLLVLLTGFSTDFKTKETKNPNTILVLRDPSNEEYFSKFNIINTGYCLYGINKDNNYPIPHGIYRIRSTSNKYYDNKNIIINE